MIQRSNQFLGLPSENPYDHLMQFLHLCDTFKWNGVSEDAIRLRLFPFSLKDKARSWLNLFPPETFTTWDTLANKFLYKYFPPSRTAQIRLEISTFSQVENESFSEAWERFKELCHTCPHHGLELWEQVHSFYQGLVPSTRAMLDAAAGGAFTKKSSHEAYKLLEDMAESNANWNLEHHDHLNNKKMITTIETDALAALLAQIETMNKKLESLAEKQTTTLLSEARCQSYENQLINL